MTDDPNDISAKLASFNSKRARIDPNMLRLAASAGRATLVDPNVNTDQVFPEITPAVAEATSAEASAMADSSAPRAAPIDATPLAAQQASEPRRTRSKPSARLSEPSPKQAVASSERLVKMSVMLPDSLHLDLKLHAAKKGVKMQELMLAWIENGLGQVK